MLHVIPAPHGTALAAAEGRIRRECNGHVLLKERIRRVLIEPGHPSVAARFGARAEMFRFMSLNEAVRVTRNMYWAERRSFYPRNLTLDVLAELHLILRFLRAKRLHVAFPAIAAEIRGRAA
jgi:hypothetical protein